MTAANEIEERVQGIDTDTVFTVADLGFPAHSYDNVRVKLGRMARLGHIVKVGRGKYFKPRRSTFGILAPSREELVKDLLFKDGKAIGYLTGHAVWNKMGLTTQIPNIIEIGSNIHRNKTHRACFDIRFVLQPNEITLTNIPLLQIMDAVKAAKSMPDATIDETVMHLVGIIKGLTAKDSALLASIAIKYPPQTRALTGAILEYAAKTEAAAKLRTTLNPLTKYKIGLSTQTLTNLKDWYIL